MATYQELLSVVYDKNLSEKILVAGVVAADVIRLEAPTVTNHEARLNWARKALESPAAMRDKLTYAVLAQNRSATLTAILAADDAAVQTAVNAAVDLLAV